MLWPLENGHSVVKFTTEGETVAASRPCLPACWRNAPPPFLRSKWT